MNANQQFAISCHLLAILAARQDGPVTSEAIAESVNTNPVVIRRTMSHLRKHHLVHSRPGANGGWRLDRPPYEISLREVYLAVNHEDVLAMHQHPNPDCPIGGHIHQSLGTIFGEAQNAMEMALDKFNVTDVLNLTLENYTPENLVLENHD